LELRIQICFQTTFCELEETFQETSYPLCQYSLVSWKKKEAGMMMRWENSVLVDLSVDMILTNYKG